MTPITFIQGLPFISGVTVYANGQKLDLDNILLDTGSAATVFSTDMMEKLGVVLQLQDMIKTMAGIGGVEHVIEKQIEGVQVGELIVRPFVIQLGEMNYGIPMNGILGADFLLQAGAIIDFTNLEGGKG